MNADFRGQHTYSREALIEISILSPEFDLDREPVVCILKRLKATGKLTLEGDPLANQQSLFEENQ